MAEQIISISEFAKQVLPGLAENTGKTTVFFINDLGVEGCEHPGTPYADEKLEIRIESPSRFYILLRQETIDSHHLTIFIYAGQNYFSQAVGLATKSRYRYPRATIILVICQCCWDPKTEAAIQDAFLYRHPSNYLIVDRIPGCGGRKEMGQILKMTQESFGR